MKTGKYINIGEYKDIKLGYGSVDCVNLKTIYVVFNSWVTPIDTDIKFDNILSRLRRNIKYYTIDNLNDNFKSNCIVDLDVRTKGIKLNKKSFMNLEITLFVDKYIDIKNKTTSEYIKNFSQNVINDCLLDNSKFNFFINKI